MTTNPVPGKPSTVAELPPLAPSKKFDPAIAWTLAYLAGNSFHPQFKVFCLSGTLREVVERSKIYCTNMNYRFLRVYPWLTDLDYDERFINKES